MQKLKKYNRDILYIFLLLITTIFVFYKIIFLKKIFWGAENTTYYYPYYFYISDCLKSGIFPLWSTYIFCGHPVFAVGNTGVLYPLNLPFFCFPSLLIFSLIFVLHFFIAGASMYCFVRVLGVDWFSSFFAGLTFMFCRFFFFYLHAPSYIHSSVWLPVILIFMELWERKRKFVFLSLATLLMTVQFLGGDASLALIDLYFLFFYFLFKFIKTREKIKILSGYLFLFLASISMFAFQLLPLYELTKFSFRYSAKFSEMTEGSLSFRALLAYIFSPNFPIGEIEKYRLSFYIDEKFLFFIVFPAFLLIFSFFKKDSFSKFLIFITLLSLILVLGKNTFFYKIIFKIPFYRFIRYPIKYIYIYFFCSSILASTSLSEIFSSKRDGEKIAKFPWIVLFIYLFLFTLIGWFYCQEYFETFANFLKEGFFTLILILVSFSLIILYLKNKISSKILKISIFFLLLFSLCFSPVSKIPEYEGKYFFPEFDISENLFFANLDIINRKPDFINFLKEDRGLYRIYPYEKYLFLSNIFSFYKISSIFGYSAQEMKDYKDFFSLLYRKDLFGLLNVKYILFPPYADFSSSGWRLIYSGEVKIYENKNFLPRAFFIPDFKVINRKEILEKLADRDFNPLNYVILEENPKIVKSAKNSEGKSQVKIVKYTPVEVVIDTELKDAGFLFLSDTYYPGWKVYVNGKEDKIYRANYLFKAVYLEKGKNIVRFVYKPLSFKIGFCISLLTFLFVAILLIYTKIK